MRVEETAEAVPPLLARLDECMVYMTLHSHYREADVYMVHFRRHLARALALLRASVIGTLKSATSQCAAQAAALAASHSPARAAVTVAQSGANDANYAIYFGHFRRNAPRVKQLMWELECRVDVKLHDVSSDVPLPLSAHSEQQQQPQRSPRVTLGQHQSHASLPHADDYAVALSDCVACYVAQRLSLMMPLLRAALGELEKTHSSDLVTLVRHVTTPCMRRPADGNFAPDPYQLCALHHRGSE